MTTVSDFPSARPGGWDDPAAPIPAPLALYEVTVGPQWVDYNGHMSEWCYLLVMGDSSDAFFRYIGIDDGYRDSPTLAVHRRRRTSGTSTRSTRGSGWCSPCGCSTQTPSASTSPRDAGADRRAGVAPTLVATGEQLLLHVDSGPAGSRRCHPCCRTASSGCTRRTRCSPVPTWVGQPVGLRRGREG